MKRNIMKKRISVFLLLIITCFKIFAFTLPTGDNVRGVTDIKQDEDAIIEAYVPKGTKITTPIGKLSVEGTVYFYKSGAVKGITVCSDENDEYPEIETPIGKIFIKGDQEFYESGSPHKISFLPYKYFMINVNGISTGVDVADHKPVIYFWDSGSPGDWRCQRFWLAPYYDIDGAIKRVWNLNINEYKVQADAGSYIDFYPNGNIKYISTIKTSNDAFNTPIGQTWLVDESAISFYESGELATFCIDELMQIKTDNKTFNIPAGQYIHLYKNGKPKFFKASNAITFKIGNYTYDIPKNHFYILSDDGKINKFSANEVKFNDKTYVGHGYIWFVDTFYTNGYPKKFITYDFYDDKTSQNRTAPSKLVPSHLNLFTAESYNAEFAVNNGEYYALNFDGKLYLTKWNPLREKYEEYKQYFYADEEDYSKIAMIYFSDSGIPSFYRVFRTDINGNFEYDENGFQILDETKKYFKENKQYN